MTLDSRIPEGPLAEKWNRHKHKIPLVAPNNRRKFRIIIVGSGLAGASAAATLAEQGYFVDCFCFQDSPRRAHSIAAQGGINAAKNYQNDNDSTWQLFYDTIKGGDYRSREANTYRLAEVSANIIDQCAAQGVPFAREYGGQLANRSFGGVQVSRTFYARGQTGQQLLLGAYSSLNRQIKAGRVNMHNRHEMKDVVVKDGRAVGIVTRDLVSGKVEAWSGHAVLLCTGGYSPVFFLSTNAVGCNVTAAWRAHKRGAFFANPCYTQIHPTCIPAAGDHQSKLTLMSESLRNDGRVWVPVDPGDSRPPEQIPDPKDVLNPQPGERDYYLERRYPAFGNLVPRDVASRNAKYVCDEGRGVGETKRAVYLDFRDAIKRDGIDVIRAKYGNLFQMYEKITDEDPYKVPMRIYPAPHYTMGGLWVDYNLESNLQGLFVLGEANFSDHGANRLGASALMQGLADGYFVIPYTLPGRLAEDFKTFAAAPSTDEPCFQEAVKGVNDRIQRILAVKGSRTAASIHREMGEILLDKCGMSREAEGLKFAKQKVRELRDIFWNDVKVPGGEMEYNTALEYAGRVADFLEFGELLVDDALARAESCGGHFREESQTDEGEALRKDEEFQFVSAWEFKGVGEEPAMHREELVFEEVTPTQRSYK